MKYPEIKEFLNLFNISQAYFDAHEILEEAWLEETNANTKNHPYIPLIQLAATMLHWQRANFKGAISIIKRVKPQIIKQQLPLIERGFDYIALIKLVNYLETQLDKQLPYETLIIKMS